MTGFNMPPGVNPSDIPGNRPEDVAEELFWATVDNDFHEKHQDISGEIMSLIFVGKLDPAILPNPSNQIEEAVLAYAKVVRDHAYKAGYDQGQADEQMAQAEREQSLSEKLGGEDA